MTRILIDGRTATNGGAYTYLVNVAPRLAARQPDDQFRVLVGSEPVAEALAGAPNLEIEQVPDRGMADRLRSTWLGAPRRARDWGADLYYSTSECAPALAPCPTIASFRNPNVFTRLRQGWPAFQRARLTALRALATVSALSCNRILFVSADSARWIGDRMGLPEERRAVIPHGVDPDAFRAAGAQKPFDRPYILSVSSVYRYKNFVKLIEAYADLSQRRPDLPDLVLIGDEHDRPYAEAMRRARARAGRAARRIHLRGEVPYENVKSWYAHAELFVFPSYLETFGHPLLEAMASDTPLVASDIPVFREIAGDAAFYADPHCPERIAAAMEEVLFRPDARRMLVKPGGARAREFSWDRTAARLRGLFEAVLSERAPLRQPARASA